MRFIVRRLVFYAIAAWVALTVNFFIPRAMPGNVVEDIMSKFPDMPPSAQKSLEAMLGIAHPGSMWHQYTSYLGDIFSFNFGISLSEYPAKVSTLLGETIPWTLTLVGTATVIGFLVGTGFGIVAVWRTGGWLDRALPGLTFVQALPYFFLALILIEVLGLKLKVFPLGQGYAGTDIPGWNWPFISSAIYHSVLPAFTIVITSVAGWMLQMRNVMITTIGEDYVLAGQAKGLKNRRVVMTYAARNAILPQLSGFANALGFVVSGAIVMEIVFSYPGVGLLLVNAVTSNDYPLMQAIFLVISFAVLIANLLVDLVYVFVDPRACPDQDYLMAIVMPISSDPSLVREKTQSRGPWGRLPTKAKVGAVLLGFFILVGLFGPLFAPFDPSFQNPAQNLSLAGPSAAHLLGTTVSGQDVFSQLLNGIRLTLELAFVVGVVATALSVIVGVAAAFLGGIWDEALSLVSNVFLVLPALPLLVVLLGYLKETTQWPTIIVLSILGWPWGARVIRSQTLAIRNRDFVAASRETGEKGWRIIVFDIVPNEVSLIAASFVNTVLYAIGASVALAFIGVADLNSWSLGTMLYWAQSQQALTLGAWWWFVTPGLAVALIGTSLVLLNFGIDEIGNPRLRDAAGAKRRGLSKWSPSDPTPVVRSTAGGAGARSGR